VLLKYKLEAAAHFGYINLFDKGAYICREMWDDVSTVTSKMSVSNLS